MSDSDSPASQPGSLVRSFMVTGGRTTTASPELSVETIVSRADQSESLRDGLQFESRNIYDELHDGTSVAEIAAQFELPILAALVLIGDMVAQGVLTHSELAEEIDADFLMRIRQRIEVI